MLSKCCCCIPLRTGSIVLAVFGLLGGIGSFAQTGGMIWFNFTQGILYLNGYGALLFGAIKYNEKAVFVNLVLTANIILLGLIGGIIALANIEIVQPLLAGELRIMAKIDAAAAGMVVSLLLNGYFWVCNYSFYKELKQEVKDKGVEVEGGNANPV